MWDVVGKVDSKNFVRAFWEFCRPHTIVGTTLQVFTAYFLVTAQEGVFAKNLSVLVLTWLSCIAMNIYVVGINQMVDLEIDKVNKPYLPMASGEFSKSFGSAVSIGLGLFALLTSVFQSQYLFATVATILAIGTLYSVPQVYLKGKPLWAALAIATARGLVLNLGAFLHFSYLILGQTQLPFSIIAFAGWAFGFGVVIALMKDIPDLSGDKLFGVQTLTVRLGAKPVFYLALGTLTVTYIGLSLAGAADFSTGSAVLLTGAHLSILVFLWMKMVRLDFLSSETVFRYYMLIWRFFYVEFVLFCFCFYLK